MSKATFQAGLAAGIVSGMRWPTVVEQRKRLTTYLTFVSLEPFTIGVYNKRKNWDGTLYYSTDTATWNEWDGTTAIASAEHGGEQKIYMRGTGNHRICMYNTNYSWVFSGSNVRCEGNMENLLDYETVARGEHPEMHSHCYAYMFYGWSTLTRAPELPATTLTQSCYSSMFYGCIGLTQAPELPSTTAAQYCYYSMFYGCIGLTQVPKLLSTTLEKYCYYRMFYGCIGIKLSETATDKYTKEYRIPASGTISGELPIGSTYQMFNDTGGTFTGTPEINKTYYTSNEIV